MSSTTRRPTDRSAPAAGPIPPGPDPRGLAALLDEYAPLRPAPIVPEIQAFFGRDLLQLWAAAEVLAAGPVEPPFWAYPWPAGQALARVLLDDPGRVRGKRVLDLGAGGGVTALAAVRAGAARVVANDVDPWALATAALAARRQGLELELLEEDLTADPGRADAFDVVLCADLAYERSRAPGQRAFLAAARRRGAIVLVADAGRDYFRDDGLVPLDAFTVPVPVDVEGVDERVARVFAWP